MRRSAACPCLEFRLQVYGKKRDPSFCTSAPGQWDLWHSHNTNHQQINTERVQLHEFFKDWPEVLIYNLIQAQLSCISTISCPAWEHGSQHLTVNEYANWGFRGGKEDGKPLAKSSWELRCPLLSGCADTAFLPLLPFPDWSNLLAKGNHHHERK